MRGNDEMSHYHPDILYELGKLKIRDFHRESQRRALVREAQNIQPGQRGTALNEAVKHVVRFFKSLVLKLQRRIEFVITLRRRPSTLAVKPRCEVTIVDVDRLITRD